jgi:hypothetical protein
MKHIPVVHTNNRTAKTADPMTRLLSKQNKIQANARTSSKGSSLPM